MRKRFTVMGLVVLLAAAMGGCASLSPAPKSASGKAIIIYVHVDRGIENSFNDYQIRNRHQTGEYMEKDLSNMLRKAGYAPRIIGKRSDYKPAPDTYLLTVKITNYNPGAKAARMFVGYGAGAVTMQTHYELYNKDQKSILDGDLGHGSSKDWAYVVKKIDRDTANAVTAKLSGNAAE
ncbi:MAG: hypothetical protein A2010_07250 [Nitrospirae bacterium GWD2_57_9]|nr:MAG: hypothetical protein A2010_07250 [Nitrospirae bacterium GWD2_57_9]OGW49641.1 MAG: hypothetical protein A2078_06010 [Nitrospirae bacterium GWC2_57_9]